MSDANRCPECGYDLAGHDHERCPECGTSPRAPSSRERGFFRSLRRVLAGVMIVGLGAVVLVGLFVPPPVRLYALPAVIFLFVLAPIYIAAHLARRLD